MPKVSAGEPLVIAARDWNTLLNVADIARRDELVGGANYMSVGSMKTGIIIPVKNSTGSTIDRFHAIAIDIPLISPTTNLQAFKSRIVFDGKTMSSSYFAKLAIYQETVADGVIGRAIIRGVTVAEITVTHADNDRVTVDTTGGNKLVSQFYGSGEILWKQSGAGTKWAVIHIGGFIAPPMKATANAAITAGGSGLVTIKINSVNSQIVTAYLNWMEGTTDIATGDELIIRFFEDQNEWTIIGAEC